MHGGIKCVDAKTDDGGDRPRRDYKAHARQRHSGPDGRQDRARRRPRQRQRLLPDRSREHEVRERCRTSIVVGDACIPGDMPKSAFSANSQAKVAAMMIRGELAKARTFPARYTNTCWSLIETDDTVKVGGRYEPKDGKIAASRRSSPRPVRARSSASRPNRRTSAGMPASSPTSSPDRSRLSSAAACSKPGGGAYALQLAIRNLVEDDHADTARDASRARRGHRGARLRFGSGLSQNFTKQVHMIVPYGPGGTSDILARLIGPKLSEAIGQPVIVENKPSASGNIGADFVAKQPGDGHTLLITDVGTIATQPSLVKKLLLRRAEGSGAGRDGDVLALSASPCIRRCR